MARMLTVLAVLLAFAGVARADAPPENVTPPSVGGGLQAGDTLVAVNGEWSNSPTSYRYQWLSCDEAATSCPDIAGATSSEYTIPDDLIGRYIGVEVVASNATGDSAPADSDAVGPVRQAIPSSLTRPSISGTAAVGSVLTADPGTWSHAPTSFTYYWYSCPVGTRNPCPLVPGQNAATYTVTRADSTHYMKVGVIARNDAGNSNEAVSDPSPQVRTPRPVQPTVLPAFAVKSVHVHSDGAVAVKVRPNTAGSFVARATARASALARGCRHCQRSGRGLYGRGTGIVFSGVTVVVLVRPTARARRALRHLRSLPLQIAVTFNPVRGAPVTQTVAVRVKGKA